MVGVISDHSTKMKISYLWLHSSGVVE